MKKSITATQLLEKQILVMQEGKFHGDVQSVLMDPASLCVVGLTVNDPNQQPMMLAMDKISSLTGDVVVTPDETGFMPLEGKDVLDMPVMTPSGVFLGKIIDFELDEQGQFLELLLSNGYVQSMPKGQAVLKPHQMDRLGEDVLFVNAEAEALTLEAPEEGKYAVKTAKDFAKDGASQTNEELFDMVGKKFSSSVNEIGNRLGNRVKQLDTEHFNHEINRLTENVNRELGRFVEGLMDQFPSRRRDFSDSDVMVIMKDLAGNTVTRPIHDKRGDIILMPGQLINEDKVRRIIAAEKVAELYRSAVPINQ